MENLPVGRRSGVETEERAHLPALFGIVDQGFVPKAIGLVPRIAHKPAGAASHADPRQAAPLRLDGNDDVVHVITPPVSWIDNKITGNKGAGSRTQFMDMGGFCKFSRVTDKKGMIHIGLMRREKDAPMHSDNGLAIQPL